MTSKLGFRVRFRFRVNVKLNIKTNSHRFNIGMQELTLSAQHPDAMIKDTEWLVMNAVGFGTEDEARNFAFMLKSSAALAAVSSRWGIDCGVDAPTASLSDTIKDAIHKADGTLIRDNVHGIDIFPNDPNVRMFGIQATGVVHKEPEPFLSNLERFINNKGRVSDVTRDAILLLNFALMRAEPVAQIVFSISAVEMIGQKAWSENQKTLLQVLARNALESPIGTEDERHEVALAIEKSIHRVSLTQGVSALLASLDLGHLKRKWQKLYAKRSTLIHGLAPRAGVDYNPLAFEAVSLCGHILLKLISREVPGADRDVLTFYSI
ncbi:hypothetical protein [Reyranella sp.]|uniref:hypothetical protein n=1 Tax=Reyranella sp. TaxID=1929291 RepID=UPI0037844C2D